MMNNSVEVMGLMQSRTIAARQAAVFRAWTEPELLAKWWWPARFQTTYEVDLRAGGKWRFYSAPMDDRVMGVHGEFREVEPTRRLVYTWTWEMEDEYESLVTVEFVGRGEVTDVIVRQDGLVGELDRDAHEQGWSDCLDRLVRLGEEGAIG